MSCKHCYPGNACIRCKAYYQNYFSYETSLFKGFRKLHGFGLATRRHRRKVETKAA